MPGFGDNIGVAIGPRPADQSISVILGCWKWRDATITYNFPNAVSIFSNDYGAETGLANFLQLSVPQRTATQTIFEQYLAPLVKLTFPRVADTAIADISTPRADLLNQNGTPVAPAPTATPATSGTATPTASASSAAASPPSPASRTSLPASAPPSAATCCRTPAQAAS
jgi:hypothetical protein